VNSHQDFYACIRSPNPCCSREITLPIKNILIVPQFDEDWALGENERYSLVPDKRIIKGRPFGVGFDRSHHHLQQGAPS
jgi:hypothetical protein